VAGSEGLVPLTVNDRVLVLACSSPLMINDQLVSCRQCDQCVATRIRSWCARAMLEKAMMPHTASLTLTYNEETEHSRNAARVFNYPDVSSFLKRLRARISDRMGRTGAFSFIACGEQGDRNGRIHWHVLLFSEVDFLTLGEWTDAFSGASFDRTAIISPTREKKTDMIRLHWDLWPHGFVTVQEPDYGGIRYAMSYALKDQFNVRNSMASARAARAEVFGTGWLAMSKKPPIGFRFIDRYVQICEERGFVPPSRKLLIPGMQYPWWPQGLLRDHLLAGLAAVNRGIVDRTGANAAGWSSLLYEARDSEDDLKLLGIENGEEESEDDFEGVERHIEREVTEGGQQYRNRRLRRRCGSSEACSQCLRGRNDLAAQGIVEAGGGFIRSSIEGDTPVTFNKRQRDNGRSEPNPLCGLYGDPRARAADYKYIFPQSAGASTFAKGARCG